MADSAPPRPRWLDFLPAFALAMAVAGAVMAGGGYISQLRDLTRRVDAIELDKKADTRSNGETLQQLDLRLARIEVKLEMMAPAVKEPRR